MTEEGPEVTDNNSTTGQTDQNPNRDQSDISDQNSKGEKKHEPFWKSLPGIMTSFAAVITAITGLVVALGGLPSDSSSTPEEQTVVKNQPVQQVQQHKSDDSIPDQIIVKPSKYTAQELEKLPEAEKTSYLPALVDCAKFPTANTVKSLMSWSNHYHNRVITNDGDPNYTCAKVINYRAQAHCKLRGNTEIRYALEQTLAACEEHGVSWDTIDYTNI